MRATDAAGNLSAYSNVASTTTPAAADTQAPTAPSNLTATATSGGEIDLSWAAATVDVGVTGYAVERCKGAGCRGGARGGAAGGPACGDTGRGADARDMH